MVFAVETEVLPDRDLYVFIALAAASLLFLFSFVSPKIPYIVDAAIAVAAVWCSVADEAVGPHPVEVLHRAAGLLQHNVAQGGIVLRRRAVGNGKVAARLVAGEEDGDVEDVGRALGVVGRQGHLAVGRHVQRDVEGFWGTW